MALKKRPSASKMCSAVSPTDQRSGPGFQFHCASLTFSKYEKYSSCESCSSLIRCARSLAVIWLVRKQKRFRSSFDLPISAASLPDKSVGEKSFPHQRRLSAALMKDRQRFADKLSHYQPRKGSSLSKLAGFRDTLIQQFRTARSAIPEPPKIRPLAFCTYV